MSTKHIRRITDPAKRDQASFADFAQTLRTAEAGLDLTPVGAIAPAVRIGESTPILVFNSGASIAYVAFGAQTVAAPTGPANGIPVLPNEKLMLNSGPNAWIIASSAAVFGYTGDASDC